MSTAPTAAVVFDMDGVLIDSEPLWHEAEIEAFAAFGLRLTEADCIQTTGVRIDDVVRHWRRQRPEWRPTASDDDMVTAVVRGVVARVETRGEAMPHAVDVVRTVGASMPVGLASSSPMPIIDAVLRRLELRPHLHCVRSAWGLPKGKPDPTVYRLACQDLGVVPADAVAVEDSESGLQAALNAGMTVVAVPDHRVPMPPAAARAHHCLASLAPLPELLGLTSKPR